MPRLHLRRFADEEQRIIGVSRDLTKRIESSVPNVAVEKMFYTVETADGPSVEVEELLSKIEGDAETVIKKILGGTFPPDLEERGALAFFVAFQWLRGSDQREAYQQVMNYFRKFHAMNLTREQIREGLEAVEGTPPTDEDVESMVTYYSNPENYDFIAHRNESIEQMLRLAPGLANLVVNRKWQLVRFPRECLLTSDAPVSLWAPPDERRGFLARTGFGTARELRFPLDRRHALVLSWDAKEGEGVRDLSEKHASALNFWTATNAHKWIFHHPADEPLTGLTLPPPGPKMTIDGPLMRIVPDGK